MERSLRYVCRCRIAGRLYDLGSYPGLVAGDGIVIGELFEIRNAVVLKRLDAFEGHNPRTPSNSLFRRELVRLVEPDVAAWVYFHNRPTAADRPVASGDWVQHQRRQARRGGRRRAKPPLP